MKKKNYNISRTTLSIDGAYSTSQMLDPTRAFTLRVQNLMLGTQGKGFQGCVGTYRWSKQILPLSQPMNRAVNPEDQSIVSIKDLGGVTEGKNSFCFNSIQYFHLKIQSNKYSCHQIENFELSISFSYKAIDFQRQNYFVY